MEKICPSLREIETACPDSSLIKAPIVLFDRLYFAYEKDQLVTSKFERAADISLHLLRHSAVREFRYESNVASAQRLEDFPLAMKDKFEQYSSAEQVHRQLQHCNTIIYDDVRTCQHPMMCRCTRSGKGIRADRLDDDPFTSRFHDCKEISFGDMCDGFVHLVTMTIDGRNETDESECEDWPFDNMCTNCDLEWNCPEGTDEAFCFSDVQFHCPHDHQPYVSPQIYQLGCLHLACANESRIDCSAARTSQGFIEH